MESNVNPRARLLTFVSILSCYISDTVLGDDHGLRRKVAAILQKLLANAAFRGGFMAARFLPLDQSDPVEIAGYVLRARLGSGGMGNVYLSFTRGGRPAAIQGGRQEFADDPRFRLRVRQEITVAQRVQGLFTAPVLDPDPDAPIPWLATAYIAGPSLAQAVAEHGAFPTLSVFRLMGGGAE